MSVVFVKSAFKHGIDKKDIYYVIENFIAQWQEDDDPVKILLAGYDTHMRMLEVGIVLDDDQVLVIHAMKIRKKYLSRIEKKRWH